MAIELGEAYVTIGARFAALRRGMAAARRVVSSAMSAISSAVKATMSTITTYAKRGGFALAAGIALGVRQFAKFESQLAKVSTMLDRRTMPLMKQYRDELKRMAVEFGDSTESLSEGLYTILSAGVPAEDALKALRTAAMGAVGGFTSTAVATEGLISVMKAYGASAERIQDAMDMLHGMVLRGRFTFEQLGVAIGDAAPMAALTGLTFQELAATLATATRQTGNLAEGTAAMRALLQSLIDPQEDAIKLTRQLGLDMSIARIRQEGLLAVMKDFAKLSLLEQKTVGGAMRGFKLLAPVLLDVAGMESDLAMLHSSGGRALEAYGKVVDTVTQKFARMKQRMAMVLVWVGEKSVAVWNSMAKDLKAVWTVIGETVMAGLNRLRALMAAWLGSAQSWRAALDAIWLTILERMATIDIPFRKLLALVSSGWDSIRTVLEHALRWMDAQAGNLWKRTLFGARSLVRGLLATFRPLFKALLQELAKLTYRIAESLLEAGKGISLREDPFGFMRKQMFFYSRLFSRITIGIARHIGTEPLTQQWKNEWTEAIAIIKADWEKTRSSLETMPEFPWGKLPGQLRDMWRGLDQEARARINELYRQLAALPTVSAAQVGGMIEALRAAAMPRTGGRAGGGLGAGGGGLMYQPVTPGGMQRAGAYYGEQRTRQMYEELREMRRLAEERNRTLDAIRQKAANWPM